MATKKILETYETEWVKLLVVKVKVELRYGVRLVDWRHESIRADLD
jgi:hypothetical protein